MSYTFVKISSYYRGFLHQYYLDNPQIGSLSYNDQHRHLMAQAYGWSDFYARNLRLLGIEAHEIVRNATVLQETWAREYGIQGHGDAIILEQLKELKPTVVFFQDSVRFPPAFIKQIREQVDSVKLIIGWCCTVYSEEQVEDFREYDFMMVCSESFELDFQKRGLSVFRMNHAFEPSLLHHINYNNQYEESDITFIGSIIPGRGFHSFRAELIDRLIRSDVDMKIFAAITVIDPVDLILRQSAYVVNAFLKSIGLQTLARNLPLIQKTYTLTEMPHNMENLSAIQQKARPPVYGLEMFKALSKSKIGFNVHGDIARNYAANIRMFEITGVGSCMLTDWKKNMGSLFEEDTEIVMYRSMEECIEKIQWLLDHDKDRKEIAARGQKRVFEQHTYRHRSEQLHDIILKRLRQKM